MTAATAGDDIRIRRGSEEQARLTFTNGVAGLQIVAGAPGDDLCHVSYDGAAPEVSASGGSIRVQYPGISAWPRHKGPIVVALHPDVAWAIEVDGGAEDTGARLGEVSLTSFSVRGAKGLELELGRPKGTVAINLGKGVDQLTVTRPEDVATRLHVQGGASDIRMDHQSFGAVGGPVDWETPGYGDATHRYDITVTGGASGLSIATA